MVEQKPVSRLIPTSILHQTSLWGRVKARLGWHANAFDIEGLGDMLVITKPIASDRCLAYVPFGPERLPSDEERGPYLEALSEELKALIPEECLFIRYDLPWSSPYADDRSRYDEDGHWLGCPDPEIRELRMNFGTKLGRLRKSFTDIMPPDTVVIDLEAHEDAMLSRMRQSTRRNIALSRKNDVTVEEGGEELLDRWYVLYRETAERNSFSLHGKEYFQAALFDHRERPAPGKKPAIRILLASKDGEPAAAMFFAVSGRRATYLYGASSDSGRKSRAPYALQWDAIRRAKQAGCLEYDMFGCSPRPDPRHPLFGLYQFKIGFGGSLRHRQGSWDYPLNSEEYEAWRTQEAFSKGYHLRSDSGIE